MKSEVLKLRLILKTCTGKALKRYLWKKSFSFSIVWCVTSCLRLFWLYSWCAWCKTLIALIFHFQLNSEIPGFAFRTKAMLKYSKRLNSSFNPDIQPCLARCAFLQAFPFISGFQTVHPSRLGGCWIASLESLQHPKHVPIVRKVVAKISFKMEHSLVQ